MSLSKIKTMDLKKLGVPWNPEWTIYKNIFCLHFRDQYYVNVSQMIGLEPESSGVRNDHFDKRATKNNFNSVTFCSLADCRKKCVAIL